jgi:hypothetical protein
MPSISSTTSGLPSAASRIRSGVERLEQDRGRVHLAAAPPRSDVEELGPRHADEQDRGVPGPVGEVLDKIQERGLGPVDVVEHDDERPLAREVLEELAHRPDGVLGGARVVPGQEPADERADPVSLFGALEESCELGPGGPHVVGPLDAGGALDRFGDRVERDPLAVGQAPTPQDGRAGRGTAQELEHEPRLPHAGRAEEREQVRGPLADGAVECTLHEVELVLASNHRRVEMPRVALAGLSDRREPEGRDGLGLALQVERGDGLGLDRVPDEAVRRLAEEGVPWFGGLLEPGGDVHGVARDEPLAGGRIAGHDLARVHADAGREANAVVALELGVQVDERGVHAGCGADGAQSVVLVEPRDTEHRHDGVTDELLDGSLVPLDHRSHPVEVAGHDPSQGFGVQLLAEGGRAGHVGKDDADDLAGLAGALLGVGQRGRAVLAEPGSVRVLLAAGGAALHDRILEWWVDRRSLGFVRACSRAPPCPSPQRSADVARMRGVKLRARAREPVHHPRTVVPHVDPVGG